MGFAVAQIVDRWRSSELSLCLARSVHSTSLTVLVSRLSSQVLTCWRETLGLKELEMSLKDKGGYESWTRPQLQEKLRARKARVSGRKKRIDWEGACRTGSYWLSEMSTLITLMNATGTAEGSVVWCSTYRVSVGRTPFVNESSKTWCFSVWFIFMM